MKDDMDARLRADGAAFRGEAGTVLAPGRRAWLAPAAAAAAVVGVAAGAALIAGQPARETGPAGGRACDAYEYVSSGAVENGDAAGPDAAVYGWTTEGDALTPTRLSEGAVRSGVSPNPDGTRLLYAAARDEPPTSSFDGRPELYVLDLATRQERQLLDGEFSDSDPAWSPDGRWIAFSRRSGATGQDVAELWVVAADGTGARRVLPAVHGDSQPAWSPDSRRLAFVRDGTETDAAMKAGSDLAVVDLDGGGLEVVKPRFTGGSPAWSPDGQRLAYAYSDYPAGGFARVAVLDVDRPAGAALTTPQSNDSPSWSSDGQLLTREADGDGDVTLVVRGARDAAELGRRGLAGQAPTAGIVALPCGAPQPTPESSPPAAAYKPVPWTLEQPSADDTTLRLQVQERGCASGEPATGRVRHTVEELAEQVVVRVDVTPRPGDSLCPANPVTPYTVPLTEPLGDRTVVNGNHGGTTPARMTPAGGDDSAAPERSLADRYDDPPPYPGEPWTKDGKEVPRDELVLAAGPEHCDWQESTSLRGRGLSAPRDERGRQWVRDPKGVLGFDPRAKAQFRARAELPADAAWTGYVQDGVEVWVAPNDDAEYVYLVNSADRRDVERWVRGGGLCA